MLLNTQRNFCQDEIRNDPIIHVDKGLNNVFVFTFRSGPVSVVITETPDQHMKNCNENDNIVYDTKDNNEGKRPSSCVTCLYKALSKYMDLSLLKDSAFIGNLDTIHVVPSKHVSMISSNSETN